jgi:serine/threonine protein kinase
VLQTYLGTENYMPPEIYMGMAYQGRPADIFTAAIILFCMVAEHPPFTFARPDDTYYKCISGNRSDLYWKLVSKGREDNFFSNDF